MTNKTIVLVIAFVIIIVIIVILKTNYTKTDETFIDTLNKKHRCVDFGSTGC